jgi:hypothetical protein
MAYVVGGFFNEIAWLICVRLSGIDVAILQAREL